MSDTSDDALSEADPAVAGLATALAMPRRSLGQPVVLRRKLPPGGGEGPVSGQLRLPFDLRQKTRLRAALTNGEEVAISLPRGELLRGGDRLLADDDRVIQVIAEEEDVLHVTCAGLRELVCAAYHLGNRHVAVQVGEGYLRIADDHVLATMLRGLGAELIAMRAPFEPEAGAYGGGHSHGGESASKARIHSYGGAHGGSFMHSHGDAPAHSHDDDAPAHSHDHDAPAHSHDHDVPAHSHDPGERRFSARSYLTLAEPAAGESASASDLRARRVPDGADDSDETA